VDLVLYKDGHIVGFCGGGPAHNFTTGHTEDDAELYAVTVDTQQSDSVALFQELLIARFCSVARQKGYKRCFAWVHKQERVLFTRPHSVLVNAKEIEQTKVEEAAERAKRAALLNDPTASLEMKKSAAQSESKNKLCMCALVFACSGTVM
jgi:hypothetical protein